jgi:hypothetical protein
MSFTQLQAPPGYEDLCARLQIERDSIKFRMLVEEINRLLTAYEKSSDGEEGSPTRASAVAVQLLVCAA